MLVQHFATHSDHFQKCAFPVLKSWHLLEARLIWNQKSNVCKSHRLSVPAVVPAVWRRESKKSCNFTYSPLQPIKVYRPCNRLLVPLRPEMLPNAFCANLYLRCDQPNLENLQPWCIRRKVLFRSNLLQLKKSCTGPSNFMTRWPRMMFWFS